MKEYYLEFFRKEDIEIAEKILALLNGKTIAEATDLLQSCTRALMQNIHTF